MNKNQLEHLQSRIITKEDKILIEEAIKSFEVGALRSAYIMTWIAIAEGLRSRISELAARDSHAAKIISNVESQEKQGQVTDQLLLDGSKNLAFVDQAELKKLQYIKDMRNEYAHPKRLAPSATDVIAAMANAVDIVLGRTALLRHGFANQLVEDLLTNIHYIDDTLEKIIEAATVMAPKFHPDVQSFFIREFIKSLDPMIGDAGTAVLQKRGLIYTRELLNQWKPDLKSASWALEEFAKSHPKATSRIFSTPAIFPQLSERPRNMVFGNLIEPVIGGSIQPPDPSSLESAAILDTKGLLSSHERNRLMQIIKTTSYEIIRAAHLPFLSYQEKVLTDLRVLHWYTQNPAADELMYVDKEQLSFLSPESLIAFGRAIAAAADGKTVRAEAFINKAMNKPDDWHSSFTLGALMECFVNESGKFRLKVVQLEKIISIAVRSGIDLAPIVREIETSEPKYFYKKATELYSDAEVRLNGMKDSADDVIKPAIQRLINAAKSRKEIFEQQK